MPLSSPYKSGVEGGYGNATVLPGSAVANLARTANGNDVAFSTLGPVAGMVLYVNVTTATGTGPTLTVKLQDSPNGGVDWYDVASSTSITAAGLTVVRINMTNTPCSDYVRVAWVIGGTTPSFTFKVDTYSSRQG